MNITSQILKRRAIRVIAGVAILVAGALLMACWQLRIWSTEDIKAYYGMSAECHPVWMELNSGRIRSGQSVEEVIRQTQPTQVHRFGEFVDLEYQKHPTADGIPFTNLMIVAQNGKLITAAAGSCTWTKRFFGTEEQWQARYVAWNADFESRHPRQTSEQRSQPGMTNRDT